MKQPAPQSILIIKTSSIGDVVLTTPVAEALKRAYPDCYLAWVAEDKVADVVLGNPFLDEVIVWERRRMREFRKARRWKDLFQEIGNLRRLLGERSYDYCFDLQGFDRTLLLHALLRARRRVILPSPDRWHGYGKHIWEREPRVHAVDYHLSIFRNAGFNIPMEAPRMMVPFAPEDDRAAQDLLHTGVGSGPIIAINPLSTWVSKEWERSRYVDLGHRLRAELDARIVVIGGQGESPACDSVASAIGYGAFSVAGKTTLKQLAALLTHCSCLITSDSGPMHISVAVGTPVVAIFGPTDPANFGPRGSQHTVIYRDLACSPCMNKHFENPSCMDQIAVDGVLERVRATVGMERCSLIPTSSLEHGHLGNSSTLPGRV